MATDPSAIGTPAERYTRTRARVIALASTLSADQAGRRVAACPGWSVHDVIAHMTGIVSDILENRLEGLGTPVWTAVQVDTRRGSALLDVVAEWAELAPRSDPLLAAQPDLAVRISTDAINHEHDIHTALGTVGDRENDDVVGGACQYASLLVERLAASGGPAIQILGHDGATFATSEGTPSVTLQASAFEVLRALSGRRTETEVAALRWRGNTAEVLPHVNAYGSLATESLGEHS